MHHRVTLVQAALQAPRRQSDLRSRNGTLFLCGPGVCVRFSSISRTSVCSAIACCQDLILITVASILLSREDLPGRSISGMEVILCEKIKQVLGRAVTVLRDSWLQTATSLPAQISWSTIAPSAGTTSWTCVGCDPFCTLLYSSDVPQALHMGVA